MWIGLKHADDLPKEFTIVERCAMFLPFDIGARQAFERVEAKRGVLHHDWTLYLLNCQFTFFDGNFVGLALHVGR